MDQSAARARAASVKLDVLLTPQRIIGAHYNMPGLIGSNRSPCLRLCLPCFRRGEQMPFCYDRRRLPAEGSTGKAALCG